MHRITMVTILTALLVVSTLTMAQTSIPLNKEFAFEVASVKPNVSGSGASRSSTLPGGRGFAATNIPLRLLIQSAYRLKTFQLTGGPAWIDSQRYDINARAAEGAPPNQVLAMLRAMLADRFKLVVHAETKEQPIYALVLARADGRLGPQMKPSTVDCTPPTTPERGPQTSACGTNTSVSNNSGTLKGTGRLLADIAETLGNFVADRMVIDRTGLTGRFDIELKWTPDNLAAGPAATGTATVPDGASVFTAIQEQLGLKLEPQRGAVEFLVIDSIEQPTPD